MHSHVYELPGFLCQHPGLFDTGLVLDELVEQHELLVKATREIGQAPALLGAQAGPAGYPDGPGRAGGVGHCAESCSWPQDVTVVLGRARSVDHLATSLGELGEGM